MKKIELTEQFFEDEVREGFYVSSSIKQAWGAEIQVFNEIDKICRQLDIKYFVDMGTFLGAVRHRGFIPWDDDFDICMLRDDYNRFLKEGVPLLPDDYAVYNLANKEDHTKFFANVVAKSRICFEPEHLKKYHGFPYITAIDLFLLDYVSNDKVNQDTMRIKAQYVIKISDEIREGRLCGKSRVEAFDFLEKNLGIKVPRGLNDSKISKFLDLKAEELFSTFVNEKDKSENVVYMMPFGLNNLKFRSTRDYSMQVDMPFESGTVPVPLLYNDALRQYFGNYMILYKGPAGHDYPFFEKSREQLKEVLDFELPDYNVDAIDLIKREEERDRLRKLRTAEKEDGKENSINNSSDGVENNTYKAVVNECLIEMEKLDDLLTGIDDVETVINVCGRLQQLAIDLGTYMEAVKGEGYNVVFMLEDYCEALYELAQADSVEIIRMLKERISEGFNEISKEIKIRKEVLFLPFKGEYWGVFSDEYEMAMNDPNTDVYIVPIPYYYKDYMGRLNDMQYATEKYPSDLKLTHYDKYDYSVHHPDTIYIQNPYDEWNVATSLPPFFYSENLLKYTDRLVYIPWFRTCDFTPDNDREYKNMKYYCTVPGVINADTVILHSDTIRNTYIEKLCEFAGESTREIWRRKLIVSDEIDSKNKSGNENNENSINVLLYYPDFSDVLLYGQKAIDKMMYVVKLCTESADAWNFIFIKGKLIESVLKYIDKELYDMYMKVIDYALSKEVFEIIDEEEMDYLSLVNSCVAYYGDGGYLAHMFRNAGKPVKIQDYDTQDLDDVDKIFECPDFNKR